MVNKKKLMHCLTLEMLLDKLLIALVHPVTDSRNEFLGHTKGRLGLSKVCSLGLKHRMDGAWNQMKNVKSITNGAPRKAENYSWRQTSFSYSSDGPRDETAMNAFLYRCLAQPSKIERRVYYHHFTYSIGNNLQFILLALVDSIHVIHQYTDGNFFIEGKDMYEDSLLSVPDVPVVLMHEVTQSTLPMTGQVELHFTDLLDLETAFFISNCIIRNK